MAELDERLSHLFSDEDSMKRVLELASALMAEQKGSSSQEGPPKETPVQESKTADTPPAPDLASVLNSLGASSASTNQKTDAGNTSPIAGLAGMLPQLLQVLSGNASLLQDERVNLIRAMQPYMSQNRAGSVDRAMRMANLTKAAMDILKLLGR